jgi:3-deoxy-manno-octulosonate cytidylyltransferase (CMP-KDO synthetase)
MTIAVIPARYGSSRLEGKPLAMIAGKPMIQRVYEQAQRSAAVSKTIVATDDQRIVDAVKAFGGNAMMTSDNCRSGTDRVAETANLLDLGPDEVLINIQWGSARISPGRD